MIDMIAQILGLANHTVLKLQFLHIIIWICEETDIEDTAEGMPLNYDPHSL